MHSWLKSGLWAVAILVLLAAVALGIAAVWPRAAAQAIASHLLERRVTVAELEIGWGDPLHIRLRDLGVAGIDGGSATHVITIAALDAQLDRKALFDGRMVYRSLRVEKPVVVLERDAQGHGNWHFGSGATSSSRTASTRAGGGLALVPKNRRQFPSLLDFRLTGGMVRYRASSGQWLSIPLDDLSIQSQGEDTPVTLTLDGGYNDTDAQLSATTASFNTLRDATQPFDTAFGIVTPGARLDFKGVIAEPLDFEGVQGRLSLEAPQLDALLKIFGTPTGLQHVPLRLTGGLDHTGDHWHLENLAGDLGGNAVEGTLALQEGARGKSDQIRAVLDFARLDLATLLPATKGKGGNWRGMTLQPPTAKDTAEVDLQLTARRVVHTPWQADDLTLAATLTPGEIRIERLAAALAGGTAEAKATLAAAEATAGKLTADMRIAQAEASRLLPMLGLPSDQLTGALDMQGRIAAQGATLGQAMQQAQGQGVIGMQDGRVARGLIELVSADMRTFFRQKDETTSLRCLLGVVDLKTSRGQLTPLVLRSATGTIRGAGSFSLAEPAQIDLTIRSDPKTTGSFALDIPIRLQGPLDGSGLKAMPERGAALPDLPMPALSGAMGRLAQQNPCWK